MEKIRFLNHKEFQKRDYFVSGFLDFEQMSGLQTSFLKIYQKKLKNLQKIGKKVLFQRWQAGGGSEPQKLVGTKKQIWTQI